LEEGGELIFIVPRDFIKASSSVKLNKLIYKEGTITDGIDFGDKIIFPGFSPNCIIFRFEKGNFSRITKNNGVKTKFIEMNGQLIFAENNYKINFSDLFFVKVGAASGSDKYFINEAGNEDFVCSETKETGKTRRMFYNIKNDYLLSVKDKLLERKLKVFNEKNWYMWGRNHYISDLPRIYVNVKTRKQNPFFLHECNNYDGSILAIFLKFKINNKEELIKICEELNQVNWLELGFICNTRYLFTQRSLEQTKLPNAFKKYIK
jgi:adenine-specific DNA-methyltransferase